jgi:hypothetical protein
MMAVAAGAANCWICPAESKQLLVFEVLRVSFARFLHELHSVLDSGKLSPSSLRKTVHSYNMSVIRYVIICSKQSCAPIVALPIVCVTGQSCACLRVTEMC